MNNIEHLLAVLAEEGGEVAKECHKAQRFGLDDKVTRDPNGPRGTEGPTNREKIIAELNDMLGVVMLLVGRGVLPENWQDREAQLKKGAKVEAYMEYARRVGALETAAALPSVEESPTVPVSDAEISDNAIRARHLLREELDRVKAELEAAKARLSRMTARTVDTESLKGLNIEYHEDDNRWYVHKPDGHFVWSGEPFFNAWRCALQDGQIKELRAKFALSEASLAKAHAEAAGMRAFAEQEKEKAQQLVDTHKEDIERARPYFARVQAFAEVIQLLDSTNLGADMIPRAKLAELRGLADAVANDLREAIENLKPFKVARYIADLRKSLEAYDAAERMKEPVREGERV